MGKFETLHGSLALLRNVADDVRNSVRLILEVTVCHVKEARGRESLAVTSGLDETLLVNRGHAAILLGGRNETVCDLFLQIDGVGQGLDKVLHVVALSANEAAQVQDDATGLVALAHDSHVRVLHSSKLLLVPLALALKLLSNLLLENKSLKCVITLLLSSSEANRHACGVILLLVNEAAQATVLPLVALDLDLEVLGLLRKGLGKGLEFEELG